MKRIIALAAAVLLSVGAQAATGHHAAKAGGASAKSKVAQTHKASAHKGAKKAVAHKQGAQKHAAKGQRKAVHKHA